MQSRGCLPLAVSSPPYFFDVRTEEPYSLHTGIHCRKKVKVSQSAVQDSIVTPADLTLENRKKSKERALDNKHSRIENVFLHCLRRLRASRIGFVEKLFRGVPIISLDKEEKAPDAVPSFERTLVPPKGYLSLFSV